MIQPEHDRPVLRRSHHVARAAACWWWGDIGSEYNCEPDSWWRFWEMMTWRRRIRLFNAMQKSLNPTDSIERLLKLSRAYSSN